MYFGLSKEHEMLRKAVREFAAKKIAPFADQWDAENYLPVKEVIHPMGDLGFFGAVIPEEYGGENMGWTAAANILAVLPSPSRMRVRTSCP